MSRLKQQTVLEGFVMELHSQQKRKYTGEPYFTHLEAVANHARAIGVYLGYEIGLCHDLLEDTICTADQLFEALSKMGYTPSQAYEIKHAVIELTDVFTAAEYPRLNRNYRKEKECERMACISARSQNVKYCDIIDNTKSIIKHDPIFAKIYLKECKSLLDVMVDGNTDIRNFVISTLKNAKEVLSLKFPNLEINK